MMSVPTSRNALIIARAPGADGSAASGPFTSGHRELPANSGVQHNGYEVIRPAATAVFYVGAHP